jgi:NADPH:quinone reductase-like Zn-dependent oxidoreductase
VGPRYPSFGDGDRRGGNSVGNLCCRDDVARTREELLRKVNDVISAIREGRLKVNIHCRLPSAQAADAHELLDNRKTEGKVLLSVSEAWQAHWSRSGDS